MDQCKHLCLVISIMIGELQTSAECQPYARDPEYIISNPYNKMQGNSVNSPPFCLHHRHMEREWQVEPH